MDTSEATKVVMSRIQSFDPENALKIMGYILIQDQGEKEMIRLAFSPDSILLSYINQAKKALGLLLNTPSSNPFSYPIRPENLFSQNAPTIMVPNNGFHLSISPSAPATHFPRSGPGPAPCASVLDRPNIVANNGSVSPCLRFHGGNGFGDEFLSGGGVQYHVQDELSFLDESSGVDPVMSPSGDSDSLLFPYCEDVPSPHRHPFHGSCSVNDAAFLDEGGLSRGNGFLWRSCMYFSRGFCKNGSGCKFFHGDVGDGGGGVGVEAIDAGSPSNAAGFDELLKLKALHQQRFPFIRNDFSQMGMSGGASSSSRQIYLTFPADSSFKEEDVSNYFSMYGPVQDVRIPYQQKRMFGFVSFAYPETVKLILAKGNPHFVCDSRVLVKPYKEKGKVREKKQHLDGACLSPSGIDSRDHFDHPFVPPRMLLSPREVMLRRKLEQEAELQHAIELQEQRMMNLQLRDVKNQTNNHHYLQTCPILNSSPAPSQLLVNQHVADSSHSVNKEDSEETAVVADEKLLPKGDESSSNNNIDSGNQLHHAKAYDTDCHERFSSGRAAIEM